MKTTLFIIALIGLSASMVSAQDDRKLRSDGTYSVHNYKHANKAATARKWSAQVSVPVVAPTTGSGPVANYKQPVPGQLPTGGVTVPHTPLEDVALRNYKIQRVNHGQSATQKAAGVVADKPQPQSITEGN
ncbi:hypothetical protein DYU11_31030 [Fibrisoma montanum]|uniref:Uncharacterized protein n=1 Tax=Fibrisoma montanum TaxID=2305895 RepID=A0A418LWM6_9BACT|nr:hypothetical protein [Fibrisoma montanum]RIV17680.1 hypothetical protein DYU11_31030 [Fibrisoma montanum]